MAWAAAAACGGRGDGSLRSGPPGLRNAVTRRRRTERRTQLLALLCRAVAAERNHVNFNKVEPFGKEDVPTDHAVQTQETNFSEIVPFGKERAAEEFQNCAATTHESNFIEIVPFGQKDAAEEFQDHAAASTCTVHLSGDPRRLLVRGAGSSLQQRLAEYSI